MTDCWPRLEIARFRNETDADYKARAARIREIVLTFRHRYYTRKEAAMLERELERLESGPTERMAV